MGPISALAVDVALSHLGVSEHGGNNRGAQVEAWQKRVGVPPGSSWCCAFAWCCVDDACKQLGAPNPLPKKAGVLNMWRECGAMKTFKIRDGAIFIMDHGKGRGHTGFIIGVDEAAQTAKTVEGNTNCAGSRDGDCVAIRTRSWDDFVGFIVLD